MRTTARLERIIGIDPGFGRVGFGIIEKKGNSWRHVAHGCIETSAKDEFIDRLAEVYHELTHIIKKYKPTRGAVEELFFYKNVTTAINVGQARGVILLTLHTANLPVDEFTPLEVKQAVVGYGRAEKKQMQMMVQMQLGLKAIPKPDDAADALAVALAAAASLNFQSKIPKKK